MGKIDEALSILKALGLPKAQQNKTMGSGMTNFLFFVRDERDIGFETTWQLRQNSGASVIRYLKMIEK